LDIRQAVRHYEERRRFWAREIALILKSDVYRSKVAVLRAVSVSASQRVIDSYTVCNIVPRSERLNENAHYKHIAMLLKALHDDGLVARVKRDKAFFYHMSELGTLVLEYLPAEPSRNGMRHRKEKHDGPPQRAD